MMKLSSNIQLSDLYEIISDLRDADIEEAKRLGMTGAESVEQSLHNSSEAALILDDEEHPVAICGIVHMIDGTAVPWLLATKRFLRTKDERRQFARESRTWVDERLARFGKLENVLVVEEIRTIRWLRWLGFSLHPYMRDGTRRYMFTMEATVPSRGRHR